MKKIVYYLPAIVMTGAMIAVGILIRSFARAWCVWALLLWNSGLLLSKGKRWGVLFGLAPAAHMLWMSTQETGQVINIEKPLGILLAVFVIGTAILTGKVQQGGKEQ